MPLPQATRDDFRTIESLFCDADNSDRTPIIGLGTGDLVAQLLQHVAETKPNLVFYPTSPSTKSELSLHPELSIDETASTVDIFVDQADQVDASGDEVWWTVNQGNNGPQVSLVDVPALKAAVSLSKKVVLLTRSRTTTGARLGGQLPVIIQGDEIEWEEIAEEVDDLFVTDAEITRRSHQEDANTRGFPDPVIVETADGERSTMILDVTFYEGLKLFGEDAPYRDIEREIESTLGVIAAGMVGKSKEHVVVLQISDADGADDADDANAVTSP